MTKPAKQRPQKGAAKRVRAMKLQRSEFLAAVKATLQNETTQRETVLLVARVRAAKSAQFLQQYRIAA